MASISSFQANTEKQVQGSTKSTYTYEIQSLVTATKGFAWLQLPLTMWHNMY